jgi:Ras-related protein Rab-18
MTDNLDHVFKILLIGDAGVGKSSILLQFTDGYFNENLQSTIGVDFKVKVMDAASPDGKSKRVKVTIWDTAGQERFRTLTSSYYRGAQGIILVYDVARKETFDSLSMWLQEVEQFSMGGGKEVVKLLVGNKIDQPRLVQRDLADDWARSRGMLFMEASAKTKEGISQVFNEVVQKILENPTLLSNTRPAKPNGRSTVNPSQASSSKGGCC